MFAGFMANTWIVATVVAIVAGVVGFFVVLRGASFTAHAVPNAAFAGAAGANLVGASSLGGLLVFALAGALGIGYL
ncbi:MAG: metal ABC transporter permease, partial [Acidimicrobiales bacterium]